MAVHGAKTAGKKGLGRGSGSGALQFLNVPCLI